MQPVSSQSHISFTPRGETQYGIRIPSCFCFAKVCERCSSQFIRKTCVERHKLVLRVWRVGIIEITRMNITFSSMILKPPNLKSWWKKNSNRQRQDNLDKYSKRIAKRVESNLAKNYPEFLYSRSRQSHLIWHTCINI